MTFESQSPKAEAFPVRLIVVLGLFSLAFAPILRRYVTEHAVPRWQLAYGSNQLDSGNREEAKRALDEAFAGDASLIEDYHYVQTRFDLILQSEDDRLQEVDKFTDQLVNTYEKLIPERNPNHTSDDEQRDSIELERIWRLTEIFSGELLEKGFAAQAVRLMDRLFLPMEKRGALQNNLLAYCRAIANQDLDKAIAEINHALSEFRQFDNSALLDTKAWVLHLRRENASALEFSDRAIDRFYESLEASPVPELSQAMLSDKALWELQQRFSNELTIHSSEEVLKQIQLLLEAERGPIQGVLAAGWNQMLHSIAVLRFHRIKILEGLGRERSAANDRLWLKLFRFEDESELQ